MKRLAIVVACLCVVALAIRFLKPVANEGPLITKLESLAARRMIFLGQKSSAGDVTTLEKDVRDAQLRVPDEVLAFYRKYDGMQIDNSYLYKMKYVASYTASVGQGRFIFLGDSGNNASYVYDARDRIYLTTGYFDPESVFSKHASFESLVDSILDEQIGQRL
jgi:hypothetical protein